MWSFSPIGMGGSLWNGGIPLECQIDLRHGIEKLVLLRTTDTKHNCVNLTFKAFVELDKMGFIPSLWDLF